MILSQPKQNVEVKTLNAKKLDINFDTDDFFNAFEPTKAKTSEPETTAPNKFVSKLQEVKDPFDLAQGVKDKPVVKGISENYGSSSYQPSKNRPNDDNEAKERLYALGNKKGISSEDIFGAREEKTDDIVNKYAQLKGATAISSDMFFDREEKSNPTVGFGGYEDEAEAYFMGRSSLNSKSVLLTLPL
jgi:hypothetical protein